MPSELEGNITLSSYLAHQLFSLTSSLIIPIPPLQDLKSVRRFRNDYLVMQKVHYFKGIMQKITGVRRNLQRSVDRLQTTSSRHAQCEGERRTTTGRAITDNI